jgi:hypothetical protein
MNKTIRHIATGAGFAAVLYLGIPTVLRGALDLASQLSHKAQSVEEAQSLMQREKAELGIEDRVDILIANDDEFEREAHLAGFLDKSHSGNRFLMGLNKSRLDRVIIRHELYHVIKNRKYLFSDKITIEPTVQAYLEVFKAKGDDIISEVKFPWTYWTQHEWQADIYALTGLKL